MAPRGEPSIFCYTSFSRGIQYKALKHPGFSEFCRRKRIGGSGPPCDVPRHEWGWWWWYCCCALWLRPDIFTTSRLIFEVKGELAVLGKCQDPVLSLPGGSAFAVLSARSISFPNPGPASFLPAPAQMSFPLRDVISLIYLYLFLFYY